MEIKVFDSKLMLSTPQYLSLCSSERASGLFNYDKLAIAKYLSHISSDLYQTS